MHKKLHYRLHGDVRLLQTTLLLIRLKEILSRSKKVALWPSLRNCGTLYVAFVFTIRSYQIRPSPTESCLDSSPCSTEIPRWAMHTFRVSEPIYMYCRIGLITVIHRVDFILKASDLVGSHNWTLSWNCSLQSWVFLSSIFIFNSAFIV